MNENVLIVNYSLSLPEMISGCKFTSISYPKIVYAFSIRGKDEKKFEFKLFSFEDSITSDEAVMAIEDEGFQPARIEHLLAFASKNPDEQIKHSIVALGSTTYWSENDWVPELSGHGVQRWLSGAWRSIHWEPNYRLLGVRRLS